MRQFHEVSDYRQSTYDRDEYYGEQDVGFQEFPPGRSYARLRRHSGLPAERGKQDEYGGCRKHGDNLNQQPHTVNPDRRERAIASR